MTQSSLSEFSFKNMTTLYALTGDVEENTKAIEKIDFWSFFDGFSRFLPWSELKVLLRPGIGLPTFFWWIWKKNGPKKCKNCGFYNKSTFLGHPQILNRHSRSLETLFMKCTKILFEKCKNCGFYNKSTFLGHPQILNWHCRSLEIRYIKWRKILD